MRFSKVFAGVLVSILTAACYVPSSDGVSGVAAAAIESGTSSGAVSNPPRDAVACPDEGWRVESDTNINTSGVDLHSIAVSAWIAWKYTPVSSHVLGTICLASKPLSVAAHVYLLADAGDKPGSMIREGDMYNGPPGYACTLDAPFDLGAAIEASHTYWIASDVPAPVVAADGARLPYFKGETNPAMSGAAWSPVCSDGFVALLHFRR